MWILIIMIIKTQTIVCTDESETAKAWHWRTVLHKRRTHNNKKLSILFWTSPKWPQMAPSWLESTYTFSKWNKLAPLISSKWNKFLLQLADTTLITFRWELAEYEIGHDRLITSQKPALISKATMVNMFKSMEIPNTLLCNHPSCTHWSCETYIFYRPIKAV